MADDDLATLDELKARLDWTLDSDEERIAQSALEDASILARVYSGLDLPDPQSAPRMIKTLVLRASARYMRNPDGYVTSRAGDETLAWNDDAGENAGTVYFTDDEQDLLKEIGGRKGGLASVQITAWNSRISNRTGWVPSADGTRPFPFYADGVNSW